MSCLSLGWVEQLCVYLVIVFAIVAIIKLLVPLVTQFVPAGGTIAQIINIVLWAIVAIFIIYIIFGLLSCLLGAGHLSLLR